jgi:hypothetical protein
MYAHFCKLTNMQNHSKSLRRLHHTSLYSSIFSEHLENISTLAFTHCENNSNSLISETLETISTLTFAHREHNFNFIGLQILWKQSQY